MLNSLPASQWNYEAVLHLLNRAGFGGTPSEVEHYLSIGVERSVESLIEYQIIPESVPPLQWIHPDSSRADFFAAMQSAPEKDRILFYQNWQKEKNQEENKRINELREWWLQRMVLTKRPLQEKMTLFWHGHFATSVEKVNEAYLMWRQNETLRAHALGSWKGMLVAMAQDPAMLIWLDNAQSNKSHPNENFAREVMELFSLGEGNYTEKDVQEAARAFTGWTLDRTRHSFVNQPKVHDDGEKTFLGLTGKLSGDDVINQIVQQPQSSLFICRKIWSFFVEGNPNQDLVRALASVFTQNQFQFKPLLRTIFLSEEFYDPAVLNNQVKSPVQWLVNLVRVLERDLPPMAVTTEMLKQLGQNLFAPPNVKGWDGGVAWITTTNLLNRYNFADNLLQGFSPPPPKPAPQSMGDSMMTMTPPVTLADPRKYNPADVTKLFTNEERQDKNKLLAAIQHRFLEKPLKESRLSVLRDFLASQSYLDEAAVRHVIHLLMSTPEFQLN